MENIIKIIYDKSISNKIMDLNDIKKILELLVIEKDLNNYILGIDIQPIRSNNLASYSSYNKKIIIYEMQIYKMVNDIKNNILNLEDFEVILYKNLSILQIILHEVEHANQQKKAYKENSLEAFLIRMSYLVSDGYNSYLYELCPEERLAEIDSFEEIIDSINYLNKHYYQLEEILDTQKMQRLLRGYHYRNSTINIPVVDYFVKGNKKNLIDCFQLSDSIYSKYTLNERFRYGFPITIDEYGSSMTNLVKSIERNFKNRINIKL